MFNFFIYLTHFILDWPKSNCVLLCADKRRIFHEKWKNLLDNILFILFDCFLPFFRQLRDSAFLSFPTKHSSKNNLISSSPNNSSAAVVLRLLHLYISDELAEHFFSLQGDIIVQQNMKEMFLFDLSF